MPNTRVLLFVAWLFVAYLLWQAWGDFNQPATASASALTTGAVDGTPAAPGATPEAGSAEGVPAAPTVAGEVPGVAATTSAAVVPAGRRVTVETDVLRLVIDSRGGTIVSAELLDYPVTLKSEQPSSC